jgi:DNA-binding NtrC family response regulator
MLGKLSLLIYSQQDSLFKMLDRQRQPFRDVLMFPVQHAKSAILFMKDQDLYPLIVVADESADIQALKMTLKELKHHDEVVFAIYTGNFSSKNLALSFDCGFDEFLAAPVNLRQIIQLASKKAAGKKTNLLT